MYIHQIIPKDLKFLTASFFCVPCHCNPLNDLNKDFKVYLIMKLTVMEVCFVSYMDSFIEWLCSWVITCVEQPDQPEALSAWANEWN